MARIFQDTREKRELGEKAPWWVEWRENGRRRSQKVGSRKDAKTIKAQKEVEARNRRNNIQIEKPWKDFRAEYEKNIVPAMRSPRSREKVLQTLKHFETEIKPKFVTHIDTRTLDQYKSIRLKKPGKKKGDTLSLATMKSELGALRAILNVAVRWGYMASLPQFPKVKPFDEDKPFVTAEHFDALMAACKVAKMPKPSLHRGLPGTPEDWWKALLATAWATGMRIGSLLAMRWEDVDLEAGIAISRARNNKGKRDQRHHVAAVVSLLEKIRGFDPRVFPWNHDRRTLDVQFAKIQTKAGIHLTCPKQHEHTDACHLYGFHSLRYAHATYNFGRVDERELQRQMGHASFETTKHYIKFAERHQERAYDVFLPKSLTASAGS